MQNFRDAGFIKSYPALLKLPITVSEKSLIELVLSYTDKGNLFYMNYKDIAKYLSFGNVQSVKNVIFNLRKKGYITTKQSHNFNGSSGGSSTLIVVNDELINNQLKIILEVENKLISGDLTSETNACEQNVVLSVIDCEIEENALEYNFEKMQILSEKSEIILGLINDFIPKDKNFKFDKLFNLQFENHLKSIFKSTVLEKEELRAMYQSIELKQHDS